MAWLTFQSQIRSIIILLPILRKITQIHRKKMSKQNSLDQKFCLICGDKAYGKL